jgi:heme/copper-type cytochrome/quinol oxidase subunit 4
MSGYGSVTRGSPLGCVVGILTVIPVALTVIASYGLYRIFQISPEKRDHDALQMLTGCTIAGVVGTILCICVSIWILKRTDWKNYDPDKPTSQM